MKRAFLALALVAPWLAFAQAWPNKPIRMIVPFAPGGASDFVARIIAPRLGDALGQPVGVDTKPGASGNIGMEAISRPSRWWPRRRASWSRTRRWA